MMAVCERIRSRVVNDPVARKMEYPGRMEAKLAWLLDVLPTAPEGLFAAVLTNTSVKLSQLETMLGFLQRLEPAARAALTPVVELVWPRAEESEITTGLSEDKPGRLALTAQLSRRADLLRRFARTVPQSHWDPGRLRRASRVLRLPLEQTLELVILRPKLLRGLVKPPRPVHAWGLPFLLSLGWLAVLSSPTWLWLAITLTTAVGTWLLSTRCSVAPGVLTYEPARRRLVEALAGVWRPSGVVERLLSLGVDVEQYHRACRYENGRVRVEVRDKRTLEGAAQFLTSSEDIGNCIALQNFVSWCLPSMLDDESIVLADVSCKGGGLWQQRAQLWMVAAERDGRPVLTVNSLEFNHEGVRYLDTLLPEMLEALRDVARRAGFAEVYVGISNYGRAWLDQRFPQARVRLHKVHSPELGHRYHFDSYRRVGSGWEFSGRRSISACLYAVLWGLLERDPAKSAAFFDTARNRHNCWHVSLEIQRAPA